MARVRLLLAALLAASLLAVLAVPVSASTPAASSAKFCKAVDKVGNTDSTATPTRARAKALVKDFEKAGKLAPKKVKSAIDTITKYLGIFVDGDITSAKDFAKTDVSGYAKAISTYATYVASHCS